MAVFIFSAIFKYMKLLGIDYGKKRIGISISDENETIAFPRVVLKNDSDLFEEISKILQEEQISKIILGESKDFKMKDNPIMLEIKKFKSLLEEKFSLEVVLYPEVLSSHQAAKMVGEKNKMIDASAATIILQSYLDFNKKNI